MDTLKAVLDEILAARPLAAAGTWTLWAALGALGGLALAVAAYFALDRAGAWRLSWRHAKWLRVGAVLWLLGSFAVLGSSIGGCEGSYRAARNTLDLAAVRDWAVNKSVAYAARGGTTWEHARWSVPGGATIVQLLLYAGFGAVPVRWFSQIDPADPVMPISHPFAR